MNANLLNHKRPHFSLIKGLILALYLLIGLSHFQHALAQTAPNVQINVFLQQPVSPYLTELQQDFMGGSNNQINNSITSKLQVTVINKGITEQHLKLNGSIQRLSPSPMSISVDPSFIPSQPLILTGNQSKMLNRSELSTSFGNFSSGNIVYDGFDLNEARENGVNYKLPEGFYRLCIRAYDYDMPGAYVEQCVTFQICYVLSAPYFIQPINTNMQFEQDFEIVRPTNSQINFQWSPPVATCGVPVGSNILYDFEIRKAFDGQTIQDATMNSPVLTRQNISSTQYIFDTLLNYGVLERNQRYIARVKAQLTNTPNSFFSIENNGYSQILGFIYNPTSTDENETTDSTDSGSGVIADGIENRCDDIPEIVSAPTFTGDLKNKEIHVGLFTLNVAEATKNSNDTYTGKGTIPWKPFNVNTILMNVEFKNIKVNTNMYVTEGNVITSTDASMPAKAIDLSGTNSLSSFVGIPTSTIQNIEDRINNPIHKINQILGNAPVSFPLGLDNQSIAGTNTTLAIMGITFSPIGTSMNILFNLNIPEANGWLSLGGTNFCIQPTGFAFTKGMIYLPEDKVISFDGIDFKFKKTILNGNLLADTTSTHLSWNTGGLEKIVVDADLLLKKNDLIPVGTDGKRIVGEHIVFNANFSFTKWEDWMASLKVNHDFEIKGINGFIVSVKDGMYYDHSMIRNPNGIVFPNGFQQKGNVISNAFKGFYMKELEMRLPKDFVTSSSASFGFQNFIINENGVSTSINGKNLLSISKGSIAGWGLSIDTLNINLINTAPYGEMGLKGQIRMPISKSSLLYSCILNVGSDSLNYNFSILPQADIAMEMWKAKLTFADKNSSFSVVKKGSRTIAEAHMYGGISINFTDPVKVGIPLLTFEDFRVSSEDGIGIAALKIGGSNLSKKTSYNSNEYPNINDWYNHHNDLAKGGPNPGNDILSGKSATTSGSSSEAPQDKISGFSFNIKDFELKSKSIDEYGLYFSLNINVGAGGIGIGGGTRIGIIGKISTTLPEFKGIELDSVGISGDFGPISIKGSLKFYNNDDKFGDGLKGQLNANFIIGSITAQAYFGTKGNYDYFGVGGSLYSSSGIPLFSGLVMNGFGGGYYHNMKIEGKFPDSTQMAAQPNNVPIFTSVIPENGSKVFEANLILSYANPELLYMNAGVKFQLNSSNGLSNLIINASGYLFSNPPTNTQPLARAIVNIELGFGIHPFVQGNVTADVYAGPIKLHMPIDFHAGYSNKYGRDAYYLYIGQPEPKSGRITAELLKIGKKGDALWAYLGANAYLCLGTDLPPFPALPSDVATFLKPGSGHQLSGNGNRNQSNQGVLDLLKQNPAGGFMFGAQVEAGAGLDFAIFYAQISGTIGFDMALLQFKDGEAFKSCSDVDGKPGIDGWYAVGQLYAYFGMEIGVHLGLGDLDLLGLQLGAVLQGGGPNPTWAQGTVKIQASVLGFSCSTTADFEIGSTCYPEYNPLQNVTLIENVSAKKMGIYAKPWVTYNVPVRGKNYISYVMPPNKEHPNGNWTKTISFEEELISFKKLKGADYPEEDLTSIVKSIKGVDEQMSEFVQHDAWFGDATYEVKIRCRAYTKSYGKPKTVMLQQDTVFRFTTGPAATNINDIIIKNIYPIPGQQYLLKDEFQKKGIIEFTVWPSAAGQDKMNLLNNDYEKLIQFIPTDGSPTITAPFTADYNGNRLNYTLSDELKNSTGYKMVFITAPNNSVEQFQAKSETININMSDLIKGKNTDYSVTTARDRTLTLPNGVNNRNNPNPTNITPPNYSAHSPNVNIVATNSAMYFGASNSTPGLNTTINPRAINFDNINTDIIKDPKDIQIKKNKTYVDATAQYGNPIYELLFKTSKFNLLKNKMIAYGAIQTKKASYALFFDNAVAFTMKAEGESFDIFEIKGYTRTTNHGDVEILPLLRVIIPSKYSSSVQNYKNGFGTLGINIPTSPYGHENWTMKNIYSIGRSIYPSSNQIENLKFNNPSDPFIYYSSTSSYISVPSEYSLNLYSRTDWKYSEAYTGESTLIMPSITMSQGSGGHPVPAIGGNNNTEKVNDIQFKWLLDVINKSDYNLIQQGFKTWLANRKLILETISSSGLLNNNTLKFSDNDGELVIYNSFWPFSSAAIDINNRLSFSLFGGEMSAKYNKYIFYVPETVTVAGVKTTIYKDWSKDFETSVNNYLNRTKQYEYLDNVQNRSIKFDYSIQGLYNPNSGYEKTFNFKR